MRALDDKRRRGSVSDGTGLGCAAWLREISLIIVGKCCFGVAPPGWTKPARRFWLWGLGDDADDGAVQIGVGGDAVFDDGAERVAASVGGGDDQVVATVDVGGVHVLVAGRVVHGGFDGTGEGDV